MALLTVDLGNTSAKLRLWDSGKSTPRAPLAAVNAPAGGDVRAAIEECLANARDGVSAVLSSVATPELEARFAAALAEQLGDEYLGVPPAGIENTCRDPQTVGLDRLFAARGAVDALGASVLVVDVGTALTVDAVEHTPGAARLARFLGGAIAPGPELLAGALAAGAARLPRVELHPGPPALGRDTRGAIEAGVVIGLCGAAAELVRRIGDESGLGARRVVVTGGARRLLLEPPFLSHGELLELPELVHLGLRAAALEVLAAR